ncbi:MAG: MarR family transcriptional regulator [Pseudomonadota bacterium]
MANDAQIEPFPLDEHLCFSIYGAHLALQRTYKPVLDQLGLTYPQYLALSLLWEKDAQTVGSMASELDLEPSTMTPLLKRLESADFVQRTRDPKNERQVIISLTRKGKAARSNASCLKEALLNGSGLSLKQIKELNGIVQTLRDSLKENLSDR